MRSVVELEALDSGFSGGSNGGRSLTGPDGSWNGFTGGETDREDSPRLAKDGGGGGPCVPTPLILPERRVGEGGLSFANPGGLLAIVLGIGVRGDSDAALPPFAKVSNGRIMRIYADFIVNAYRSS
jgi:hypothetical protein